MYVVKNRNLKWDKIKSAKLGIFAKGYLLKKLLNEFLELGVQDIKIFNTNNFQPSLSDESDFLNENELQANSKKIMSKKILQNANIQHVIKEINNAGNVAEVMNDREIIIFMLEDKTINFSDWLKEVCFKCKIPLIIGKVEGRSILPFSLIPSKDQGNKHLDQEQKMIHFKRILCISSKSFSNPGDLVVVDNKSNQRFVSIMSDLLLTEYIKVIMEIHSVKSISDTLSVSPEKGGLF